MRELMVKQKKLLIREWKSLKESGIEYPVLEDLSDKMYNTIFDINPCEIFHQNADRFLDDLNLQ